MRLILNYVLLWITLHRKKVNAFLIIGLLSVLLQGNNLLERHSLCAFSGTLSTVERIAYL